MLLLKAAAQPVAEGTLESDTGAVCAVTAWGPSDGTLRESFESTAVLKGVMQKAGSSLIEPTLSGTER